MTIEMEDRGAAVAEDDDSEATDSSADRSIDRRFNADSDDDSESSSEDSESSSDQAYQWRSMRWEIQVVLRLDNRSLPELLRAEPLEFRNDATTRVVASVDLLSDPREAGRSLLHELQPQLPEHHISCLNIRIIEKPRTVDLNTEARHRLSILRETVMDSMQAMLNSNLTVAPAKMLRFVLRSHPAVPYTSVMGRHVGALICHRTIVFSCFTWRCLRADFLDSLLDSADHGYRFCFRIEIEDDDDSNDALVRNYPRAAPPPSDVLAQMLQHRSCNDHLELKFSNVAWSSMSSACKEILKVETTASTNMNLAFHITASMWSADDLSSFCRSMGSSAQHPRLELHFHLDKLDWNTWNEVEIQQVVESLKAQEFCHDIDFSLFNEDGKSMIKCVRAILEAPSPRPLLRRVKSVREPLDSLLNVLSHCNWLFSVDLASNYPGPTIWTALERLLRAKNSLQHIELCLFSIPQTDLGDMFNEEAAYGDDNTNESALPSSLFRAMGQNMQLKYFGLGVDCLAWPHSNFYDLVAWIELCIKRNKLLKVPSTSLWPRAFANVQQPDDHPSLVFGVLRRRVDDVCNLIAKKGIGDQKATEVLPAKRRHE